jgi:predicted nicotinamide N-methyase
MWLFPILFLFVQYYLLDYFWSAGLPGIVAHRVLGAESVLVTDGDYDALNNLERNVSANRWQPEKGDERSTAHSNTISCLQLIWGRAVGAFLEAHGKQDVVLAADCVYMVPSLKPLWATIDALLEDNGIFVYAQTAASAVPLKDFSEMVEFYGFETILEVAGKDLDQYDVDNEDEDGANDDNDDRREDEEYEQGIYVFRRRR